jgi:hypothetical protein
MNDPDNFLSRWSRRKSERKRDAGREQTPDPAPAAQSEAATGEPAASAAQQAAAQQTGPASAKPLAFDPASLPPIESIAADTDISAFLQPGVPSDVRNAALRRAWSVDPAISNFKGLQENDWDFNDPNGIPGFGPLSPTLDVKKMVSDLFGHAKKEAPAPDAPDQDTEPAGRSGATADNESPTARAAATPDSESDHDQFVQRDIDTATQHTESEGEVKRRRRSGGALPDC